MARADSNRALWEGQQNSLHRPLDDRKQIMGSKHELLSASHSECLKYGLELPKLTMETFLLLFR